MKIKSYKNIAIELSKVIGGRKVKWDARCFIGQEHLWQQKLLVV